MGAHEKTAARSDQHLPKSKQTSLGLYVTALEAYEMWKADPDRIKIIDVRTPEEYGFIGHPDQAWNIPLAFVTYRRQKGLTIYGPKWNPSFVEEVRTSLLAESSGWRIALRSGQAAT